MRYPKQFTIFLNLMGLALLIMTGVFSCNKSTIEASSSSIYGTWVESDWDEGIQELVKSTELDSHKYGFIIYADGRFVEHANSGGCGTPPIVYARYEGRWNFISEDSLHIDVAYWGGSMQYDLKIISFDQHKLKTRTYYYLN